MHVLLATEFSSAAARLKYEIKMECSSQVTNDIRWLFHNFFHFTMWGSSACAAACDPLVEQEQDIGLFV